MPSATDTQDADKKGLDEVEEAPPCEDEDFQFQSAKWQIMGRWPFVPFFF